ncbi:response regulator transcription factor [Enterococcus sp. HY326]|uniref:response regulator transcription factor n=1 Tax=Enterococcus sp. HY326 TaxID=2971265 RepID=UPI00223F664A|nr:helix-turn-helix transcriptional regulator [Enterococcus sp. HY326]
MMVAIFIYNILLLLLYTFSLSLVFVNYLKEKKSLLLAIICLLSFFILDNVIIYMTEFLAGFADGYNSLFMLVPIVKALILLMNSFCCIWITNSILEEKIKTSQIAILIIMAIWMLSVPMLADSALKVWLFYLPNQLLLFYLGGYCLLQLKSKQLSQTATFYLKAIAVLALISGICILSEDTFVIFNLDQYSSLTLKIFNRNFSEDLFSIVSCLLILRYILKDFSFTQTSSQASSDKSELIDKKICRAFESHYQLTQRETEIFQRLLQQESNQEIADSLYLSIGTVKTHVHNIFIKLEINKRNQINSVYQKFISDFNVKGESQ